MIGMYTFGEINRHPMTSRLAIIIALFWGGTSCRKDKPVSDTPATEATGKPLRAIAAEKFADSSVIIGVTCGLWAFDYPCGELVDREFSYLTPENDFKQKVIHPSNTEWSSREALAWVEHAEQNKQIIRMHCPIGPQVSQWAQEDSRTAEELDKNMTDFLTAVCTTFNNTGCIRYMDVVNETVRNGSWFGPEAGTGADLWENPWPTIGVDSDQNETPLYIQKAFQITNKFAPNIKQLYNHHEGPENRASWELIKETIIRLKKTGIRIDAIGWQAHVDNGWATEAHLQELRELIDWAQNNGLEFHITEASVFIRNTVTPDELQLQAETYSKILSVLLEKSRSGRVGWNTWHLTDAYTYRSELSPALFDQDNNPKPAYYAIQKCLEEYRR